MRRATAGTTGEVPPVDVLQGDRLTEGLGEILGREDVGQQPGGDGLPFGEQQAVREALGDLLDVVGHQDRRRRIGIGSQIREIDAFEAAYTKMVALVGDLKGEGHRVDRLDLGGGLGIRYQEDDRPPSIDELAEVMAGTLTTACGHKNLPVPELILEPGRSIVGEAGTTLYTIGAVKHIPGVRTYLSVDGGLSDNPRPVMYDALYRATIANKAAHEHSVEGLRVSGAHCETDTLIPEIALQSPEPGDILAVFGTGAYNHSMASNYNRFCRPAMVLVADGKADLITRREELADLLRQDVMPERLK